jgi:hypothetical protein
MGKLTKSLSLLSLGVDLDQYAAEAEIGTQGKKRVISTNVTARASQADPGQSGGTSSQEPGDAKLGRQRATSGEAVSSERSSRAASGNATTLFPRAFDFASPQSLNLTKENALFVWKNVLCILGNPNQILSPGIHSDAIKAVVNIYDMLALVRACQPYQGVALPPMFDTITWIFQACAMSKYVLARPCSLVRC